MPRTPRGRLTGTASLLAALALAATALPAAAAPDSGDITVTGGSVEKIRLVIPDTTAAFGSDLTPEGDGGSAEVDGTYVDGVNDPSFGACYRWDGLVRVRSNTTYYVTITADTLVPRLGFLTSAPTDYAACAGGEVASTSMFPKATPAGGWVFNQTKTRRRNHSFSLGLDVVWLDDADAGLADSTLTITAQAS